MSRFLHAFRGNIFLFAFLFVLLLGASLDGWGAIAQRGTATSATTTNTTIIINKPTGVVAGDVMIVNICKTGNLTTNASATGWNIVNGANLGNGSSRYGTILYRVVDGTEGTSFAFSLGTGTTGAIGSIIAFSGANTSDLFDATGTINTSSTASTAVTALSITTTTPNTAVIFLGQANNSTWGSWNGSTPTFTEVMDFQNSTSNLSVGAAWGTLATVGSIGNKTATVSNSAYWGGILIALKPAPTSPVLVISPTSYDFGDICTNTSSNAQSFTISNSGTAASGISLSSNNAQFVVSGLSSTTIASGSTATFNVVFTPTSTGTKNATITVSSTTTGSNSPTTLASGIGITAPTAVATNPSPSTSATGVCYSGSGAISSVSWDAATGATSYDVYFGAGSLPGTVTSNVTTNSYTTASLSASTTYHWKIVPKNDCGSTTGTPTEWTFTTASSSCVSYCTPSSNNADTYINNFSTTNGLTNITNNVTGYTIGGYADYSASQYVSQYANGTINWSLTYAAGGGSNSAGYAIWVDWNNDGAFNDSGETISSSSTTQNQGTKTGNFTVPSGQAVGSYRMRVLVDRRNGSPDPCSFTRGGGGNYNGEAEDYTLVVVQACTAPSITSQPSTSSQSVCPNDIVTALSVTASGTNLIYQWYSNANNSNSGGTLISGATFASYAPSTAAAGTLYYYVVVSSNGCTATSNVSGAVTVNAGPAAPTTSNTQPTCSVATGTITVTSPTGTGMTYSIDGVTYTNATGTFTSVVPGTYTVTAKNSFGCVSSGTSVTINTQPASTTLTTGGGGDYCVGSTINLTSSIPVVKWTGPSGFTSASQNPSLNNVTSAMAGIYTVTNMVNLVANGDFESGYSGFTTEYILAEQNSTGLNPESTYDVVKLPSSRHGNFCSCGDHTTGNGYQMVVNGASTEKIVWATTSSLNVVPNTTYQFSYWVQTVVNGNDPNPSKLQLFVNGTAILPICTANATTGVWTQFIYNWTSGTGITTATLALKNENFGSNGNDFAIDDIVFQPACASIASVNITVNALPTASISYSGSPYCATGTASVTRTGQLGGTYSSTSGLSINSTTGAINLAASTAGTYTVTYSFSNGACSNSTTTSVTIKALPTVSITGNSSICTGNATTLTPITGGTWVSSNTSVATVTNGGIVTGVDGGTVTFTFTQTSTGCSNTTSEITVLPVFTAGTISSTGESICYGGTTILTIGSSVPASGGDGSITYQWQSSTNADFSSLTTIDNSNSATFTPPAGLTVSTYYRRQAKDGSCTSYTSSGNTWLVTVSELPQGSLTANGPFCTSGSGQLTWTATAGVGPYTIVYNDGTADRTVSNVVSGMPFPVYTSSITNTTTYALVSVTDANNCIRNSGFAAGSATITVILAIVNNTINEAQSFCVSGDPSQLTGSVPTGGTGTFTYQWQKSSDNSTWTDITGANSQNYDPSAITSTTYYRRGVSSETCSMFYSGSVQITIVPAIDNNLISGTQSFCGTGDPSQLTGSVPTGGTGAYTYQWQKSSDNSTWTDITGANSQNYDPSAITSTTYYRRGVSSGTCSMVYSESVLITVNTLPTTYNVTGGGFYCAGGVGVEVGLPDSETGVSYQLYKNGTSTGSPIAGTGLAISFGNQTAGTYTVKATNSTTSCTQDMAGTVAVTDDDTEKPAISSFPANRTVACSTDLPVVKNNAEFEAAEGRVSDNCTPDPNLIFSTSDVLDLNEGCKVTRTYTIADVSGNIATCKQVFTINDVAKPVITCNADLVSSPNTDDCAATLTITAPTAISENCSLVNISPTYSYRLGNDPSATPVTGTGNFTATFPEGNTTISWVITDLCGNTSTPCTQIIHVGFNLTSISYDNGSTETGSGSGVQPMQTSTHEYFVDDKAPEIGYTYDWGLFENNSGSPGAKVNSSLYTITNINATYTKITFTAISTGNYILSVIKTKDGTTCKKSETLQIAVQSNSSFDVVLDNLGNQCQAPSAALTTISWNVTFPNIITEPFMFSYSIKLGGTVVATGNVTNITYAGAMPTPGLSVGAQAGKSPNSRVVALYYSFYGVSGNDLARTVEIEINATDIYQVSEPNTTNNKDDLKINQVPVINFE